MPHDFVAGNGDDRLACAPVRAVDDGVPQLAVVDELGFIAADGDVEVGAALDEIGKILRRLGVVDELELRFDAVVAVDEPRCVGYVHDLLLICLIHSIAYRRADFKRGIC